MRIDVDPTLVFTGKVGGEAVEQIGLTSALGVRHIDKPNANSRDDDGEEQDDRREQEEESHGVYEEFENLRQNP